MISDNHLLLRALMLNAAFSAFSALIMFIAGGWVAEQLGLPSTVQVYALAGFLAVFALQLGNIVRTRNIRIWEIAGIIGGDIAWVIGSVVLVTLYFQSITATGLILIDIAALAVLTFAILQIRGLREFRRTASR